MPTLRIYGLPDDGTIASSDYELWPDAHADINPQTPDTASASADVFSRNFLDPNGLLVYRISRAFLYFETAVIPDNAVINDVQLNLFGIPLPAFSNNPKLVAQKGTQSFPLLASDFNAFTGNAYHIPATWQTNQYNVITFDLQGRNDINKTGITQICCREFDSDYLDVAPANETNIHLAFYTGNEQDVNKRPFIDVTYTIPDNAPSLGGFSIENDESNVVLNVQDTNGNLLDSATVTITFGTTTINTVTDNNGCFTAMIRPLVKCNLTIAKQNYLVYNSEVILVPENLLTDPSRNFIFRVEDSGGSPVGGASVTITSNIHSQSGITGPNGLFEGQVETDYINDLTISKTGFTTYTHQFKPFLPFPCDNMGYRLIPIITLS